MTTGLPAGRAGRPTGPVEVPALVAAAAGGPVEAVWRNGDGGLAFRSADRFLKFSPAGSGIDLADERVRLAWAAPYHPVPSVLGFEADASGQLLVTAALPGAGAVEPEWIARPELAVAAIGAGLRALHDALPVEECPFDWTPAARGWTGPAPAVDRLVVCHGDACAPNTIIGADGRWIGHVDLGALGVADRWADLAVASLSLGWNYGPGWEPAFFAAYGVEPDVRRIAFHRMLWTREDHPDPVSAEGETADPARGAAGRLAE